MTMDRIKERMKKQFGPGAQSQEVNGILVVHLDKPDEKEVARRKAEVLRGGPRDKDCSLCKALAKSPPSVVVYDQESVLCFGQDSGGPYASGFPRCAPGQRKARAAA